MNVAPLFSVLYIVGHYLLLYGRTNNVVKRRAALCFAACQSKKVLPAWFASVDADIRIGRRRHPHRSAQTSASVGADIRVGRRRCYRRVLLLCLTFEHKLVSDIQIAVEIQSGVSVVEVGAGLAAIEEVERTGWRYVQTFG